MNTFGQRLRFCIENNEMTQVGVADLVSVSIQSFRQWLNDENYPRIENVHKLAELLKVSPAWLLFGTGDSEPEYFVEIPETNIELSAGNGRFHFHFEVDPNGSKAAYRREWFEKEGMNPNRCIRMRVKGDSNQPFLWSADVVLVNLDEVKVVDGLVYALAIDDALYVKRLANIPGVGLKVISENPEYGAQTLGEEFDGRVQVIGRVRDKSGRGGL